MLCHNHRIPLFKIIVVISLRAAATLLKIFRGVNNNDHTQFTHASRHQGAKGPIQIVKPGQNTLLKCDFL